MENGGAAASAAQRAAPRKSDEDLAEVDGQRKPSPRSKSAAKAKNRSRDSVDNTTTGSGNAEEASKRRCVSTACLACRRRKSKCDGNTPACAACASVYGTECKYDLNSDHRRKGVYKKDADVLKTRNSTLHTLIQAIRTFPEDEVPALVHQIRTCESLDVVAEQVVKKKVTAQSLREDSPLVDVGGTPTLETRLSRKMADMRLDDGSVRFYGGTSNLIHVDTGDGSDLLPGDSVGNGTTAHPQHNQNPITSWTTVTGDADLIMHLMNMYFTWHYTFFCTVSKYAFWREFEQGWQPQNASKRHVQYCTPLLVNAMLALGCHFTSTLGARKDPMDSATAGDHFFREAKRLIMEGDEHEKPKITTVQALALMSVREAGCGREARGWVYSGMSFRMALDLGLNLDSERFRAGPGTTADADLEDAQRITFWGCFLFDKCWSNYLGRLPQLPNTVVTVPKADVIPEEEAATWLPYTDSGFVQAHAQPARTRAVALNITALCAISSDLMNFFYNPIQLDKPATKQAELKKLSEIHGRLEAWRRDLPQELEPKEGGLANVMVMHAFAQLLYIHTFRPFLKYNKDNSPLPPTVSPRKLCTQAAHSISKIIRLYKRSHGLRQVCNIVVYIVHSAATIHLLNLPDRNAKRDIVHAVKHLEEIAECWLCARRTLIILSALARKWNVELPEEAATAFARTDAKFAMYADLVTSPSSSSQSTSPRPRGSGHGGTSSMDVSRPGSDPSNSKHAAHHADGGFSSAFALPPNPPPDAGAVGQAPDLFAPLAPTTLVAPPTSTALYSSPPFAALHTPTTAGGVNGLTGTKTGHGQGKRSSSASASLSNFTPDTANDSLLRENQEWIYKDQSQLALGFDNWNPLPDEAAAAAAAGFEWFNGHPGSNNGAAAGQRGPTTSPSSMPGLSAATANGGMTVPVTTADVAAAVAAANAGVHPGVNAHAHPSPSSVGSGTPYGVAAAARHPFASTSAMAPSVAAQFAQGDPSAGYAAFGGYDEQAWYN